MNLENMLNANELIGHKNSIKKIFFFRICGTGMGACACILKEAGFEVEGADLSFSPPMSTYLDSTGIPCYPLDVVDTNFLSKYDLIIVGNSVPRMSEQARLIENSSVPFTSFPSILGAYVLRDKNVIGIAGTHGKTTTTFFITQIMENLGLKPGYFIGGIVDGRAPSTFGKDDFFVIEADEYDSAYFQKISKFRLYELNNMILTSLEFDHADIFETLEDIENEFESVIPDIDQFIIANDVYPAITKLKNKFEDKNWSIYGEKSKLGPFNIKESVQGSEFEVVINNKVTTFKTNIVGKHNILNITSCLILLGQYDFKASELQKAVAELKMVKRRQEYRGLYKNAIVIDDFAHHPKAIELTIDAIKVKYPKRKIVTVFEPVSATARSSIFQKEFATSLLASDKIIFAKSNLQTTVKNHNDLDCDLLVNDVIKHDIEACSVNSLNSLKDAIDRYVDSNSVLLVLSNRTCLGLWESDFVDQIS